MSVSTRSASVTSFSSNSNVQSSSPSSYALSFAGSGSGATPRSHLGHGSPNMQIGLGHPSHQNHQPSHRQYTGSVSGLGPTAAGLAKRAVEKMGKKWGAKIGLGSGSSSGPEDVVLSTEAREKEGTKQPKHKRTPNAKSSGWLPGAGGMFLSSGDGHGADGTGSSISSSITSLTPSTGGSSTCATSMSGVSMSISGADGTSSSGELFSPTGPTLGRILRGPLRPKGGVVFGKELRVAVNESRCVHQEEDSDSACSDDEEGDASWSLSEDESPITEELERVSNGEGSSFLKVKKVGDDRRSKKWEGLVRRFETRELPAVVVRCAQHLLIWGVSEEGLFRFVLIFAFEIF